MQVSTVPRETIRYRYTFRYITRYSTMYIRSVYQTKGPPQTNIIITTSVLVRTSVGRGVRVLRTRSYDPLLSSIYLPSLPSFLPVDRGGRTSRPPRTFFQVCSWTVSGCGLFYSGERTYAVHCSFLPYTRSPIFFADHGAASRRHSKPNKWYARGANVLRPSPPATGAATAAGRRGWATATDVARRLGQRGPGAIEECRIGQTRARGPTRKPHLEFSSKWKSSGPIRGGDHRWHVEANERPRFQEGGCKGQL